ncbi:hypothetical protein J4464_03565 [Candidatus Woesearchaeota archaeon]|nr:hypothetical protein [Candidatus Woesearchaeota archaeon]
MKSMHLLLNEAEREWRNQVRDHFPLRSDTPVIRDAKPNGRDWTFSTDLSRIFAHIGNDESLQRKFREVIAKYWSGDPEELARETLHYLLHHELYHPLEAPFSVTGTDNDNKRIHQAIRRGVLQAEPGLSPLEQIVKVQASQNGVKDFILDNRFFLDNKARGYVREDIVPTWDMLELQDALSKTNFYTITRLLYGLMYGPQSTHKYFESKSGKKGHEIAEKALSALIGKPAQLPGRKRTVIGKAKAVLGTGSDPKTYERIQEYAKAVREIFAGKDRYAGIERLMKVLGPYVEKGMPQGRPDMQGEGSGTSPQNILHDLLDDMSPSEQQQFTQSLVQAGADALNQAANQTKPKSSAASTPSSVDEMRNLDLLATHEFYKRNHPKVVIVGGKKVGESIVVGKQEYWHLKNSTVLTEDQLSRVNLQRIDLMQRRTRLPWLIDLGNGTFRLNEYDLKQRDVKDIVYVDAHLDVPDVVEFYLDSSASMFGYTPGIFKVNDGSRWDMLSHVIYGFADALQQSGRQIRKQSKIRFHNFADHHINSELVPVDQFWRGDLPALKVLFKPENGYAVEDLNIQQYSDGQRRTYVVVTDGDLVISGRTEREAGKMKRLAKNPNNHVVLFEIGGTYALGNAVRNQPGIVYHPVHDKEKMLQAGLKVLLSKREEMAIISGVPKITGGDF